MNSRLLVLPLLLLTGGALSGCVAAAIPALAGSAMFGTGVSKDRDEEATDAPVRAAAAPVPAPVQPQPQPQAPITPAAPDRVTATETAPPASAPSPQPAPPLLPQRAEDAPAPSGMAQMVRYSRAVATASSAGTPAQSALLADPFDLDGKRRVCERGVQPVAVIDLDPAGRLATIPAAPQQETGLALGLAVLREAGVVIAWLSDLPIEQAGNLRSALEQSGLDPRGQDIIALSSGSEDRKQLRRENLGAAACIIAIAGDERPDFDERFRYLRNPEAGAALESLIGDGWFLIDNIFAQ